MSQWGRTATGEGRGDHLILQSGADLQRTNPGPLAVLTGRCSTLGPQK